MDGDLERADFFRSTGDDHVFFVEGDAGRQPSHADGGNLVIFLHCDFRHGLAQEDYGFLTRNLDARCFDDVDVKLGSGRITSLIGGIDGDIIRTACRGSSGERTSSFVKA